MNIGSNQRLEYIDALRGFTMILVVYCHISCVSLGIVDFNSTFSFNAFFMLLRMPLFFFVSGFVLYKATQLWNLKNSFAFILKKFKVQIISTSIFFILFCYIFNKSVLDGVMDASKYGYWFTIALFFFFVLFIITDFIIKRLNCKLAAEIFIWLTSGIVIRSLSSASTIEDLGISNNVASCLGLVYFKYYIFFVLGVVVKKVMPHFFKLINNGIATALIVVFFFVISIVYLKNDININVVLDDIVKVLIGAGGIITVFTFFYKYQNCFTKEKCVGRTLQYIGRRTLDIYLLHYLFLPHNLNMIGEWFTVHNNPTLELFIGIVLASMVIALCLVVSSIIRISPLLANWLFGVKTPIRN